MTKGGYDLVIIGAGPGGYVSAIRASRLGLKACVVERDKVGGRCLNYACIPAKAVLRSAELYGEVLDAKRFGVEVEGARVDWANVGKYRDRVIRTMTSGVSGLLKKNGVDVVEGSGTLTKSGDVRYQTDSGEDGELSAGGVVLASGSKATSIPGVEFSEHVIGTAGAWRLDSQPERLAVVGAGASGTEIASAYGRFGTRVLLIEMLDRVLPTEDVEVSETVEGELSKQSVEVLTGTSVETVEQTDSGVSLHYRGSMEEVDALCIATGRVADTDGLGLEDAGVEKDENGLIKVDGRMRTSAEKIYAIGDLVRGPALAHKASDEGVIAAEDAAGQSTRPLNYENIPAVTFCHPQVASFGLTEEQARERHGEIRVGSMPFGSVGAATVYGAREGFVKIVSDAEYGEILGAHIVGARATELIAELVVASSMEGGLEDVARIVHAHPTFSEGVMEAARDAGGWVIHA